MVTTRLLADRRRGVDQRAAPRRASLASASPERRRVVDRRRGSERRSTIDRRDRTTRDPTIEAPGEHVRNALQLLTAAGHASDVPLDRADLAAAVERLRKALRMLERRSG